MGGGDDQQPFPESDRHTILVERRFVGRNAHPFCDENTARRGSGRGALEGDRRWTQCAFRGIQCAFIHTPSGFGTFKLAAKFDKGIGVANTARNWNTVLKMHALAQGLEGK